MTTRRRVAKSPNRHARRAAAAGEKDAQARANAKIRQLVAGVHQRVDDWQAEHMEPRVVCADGCSACCEVLVLGELAEAEYIVARHPAEVARAMPKLVEQERLLDQTIDGAELTAALHNAGEQGAKGITHIAAQYRDLKLRCAFLSDDDRRCTIYASRPLACRTHFALDDAEQCAVPHGEGRLWNTPMRAHAPAMLMRAVMDVRAKPWEPDGEVFVGLLQTLIRSAWEHRKGRRA